MTALVAPDEEECYLLALIDGDDGIDLAEFSWLDEESDTGCFRAWDFQWPWYTDDSPLQADQCGRALGKSNGIAMRAFAFPFNYPGQQMLLTAPELNHLRPIIDLVESKFLMRRLGIEMLPRTKGRGISRQPHWTARFANGAIVTSRLPNRDGKGVKGQHPLKLELDEAQDYPLPGWIELIETLKRGSKGASWRLHGVPRGVRDKFYELTQPGSDFKVHRIMAMARPSWTKGERDEKERTYGGSRQNPDYKRNIYGEHGDQTNPLFVLARLMACVDRDEGSTYNTDVYTRISITYEQLSESRPPESFLDIIPGLHKVGYSQSSSELDEKTGRTKPPREVGSPKGYSAYYGGMDVGMTNHPSEILLFGQRTGTEVLELILRIHMQRIDGDGQEDVIRRLFQLYGAKLKAFGMDRTGLGLQMWQTLQKEPFGDRIFGYNFSEKVIVGLREPGKDEDPHDVDNLLIERNVVEHSSDILRSDWVDPGRVRLPYDRELLTEWQGQNYTIVKSAGDPYGKRAYSAGKFHTLDAAKMAAAAKTLPSIAEMVEKAKQVSSPPVLDAFVGAMF